jgi:hypothetical protein
LISATVHSVNFVFQQNIVCGKRRVTLTVVHEKNKFPVKYQWKWSNCLTGETFGVLKSFLSDELVKKT